MAIVTCHVCGQTDVDSWGKCVHCGTPFDESAMSQIAKTKTLVVGRHGVDLGAEAEKYEVVANEAVTFALKREEVKSQVRDLEAKATAADAQVILLQNVPGVLASALVSYATSDEDFFRLSPVRWGIIISVPGERQAGVVTEHEFPVDPDAAMGFAFAQSAAMVAEAAVKAANGRAKTERIEIGSKVTLRVTVDPVAAFLFSHIEWL